jgi:acetyl-CoA carboxylase carboxyl transferase subunit alpha
MDYVLDFEHPVIELHKRIETLEAVQRTAGTDLSAAIDQLRRQAERLQERIFASLTPWQRTQLSRHPARPYALDYVDALITEWLELHGDRAGHDDASIITGMGRFRGQPVAVVGHQKGRNTRENIVRNFGMTRPEGYRKALRVMSLANRHRMPVLAFVDTPGAFPGVDAEERGQAEAIARNILEMSTFEVPVIVVVTGEGGSGGALALGVGNRVIMLENSVYSVISPEGCAAILWRDRALAPRVAEALRITAADCLRLGVIDEVVPEPVGGAHRAPATAVAAVGDAIGRHLDDLASLDGPAIREDRYLRFRKLGALGPDGAAG